jgi:two-component system nitrogen regulation sensor histidine kinase NtrY
MIYKKYEWRFLLRVLALFITLTAAAFIIVKGFFIYLVFVLPVIIYQMIELDPLSEKSAGRG